MNYNEKLAWLCLYRSENVGPATFYRLLNHFGSAEKALAHIPAMAGKGGARQIKLYNQQKGERELKQIAKHNARLITANDDNYPRTLKAIAVAPPVLTVKGNIDLLKKPCVAIVGARNCSAAGRKYAWMIAKELTNEGFAVISGLARGIDTAAHFGGISATGAVFAGGIDHVYPPQNAKLSQEIIANNGILISEQPIGYGPRNTDFPRRNRIIAGLALAVVVIEAAYGSGSLITAEYSVNFGREVFAVAGSPLDPRSHGANKLIKDGANIMTNTKDISDILKPLIEGKITFSEQAATGIMATKYPVSNDNVSDNQAIRRAIRQDYRNDDAMNYTIGSSKEAADYDDKYNDDNDLIMSLLSKTPVTIDQLIEDLEMPVADIQISLLQLEIAGRIERHPGGTIAAVY